MAANVLKTDSDVEALVSTLELSIQGMTCQGCARAIENALQGLEGIEQVEVRISSDSANITFDSKVTSAEEITERVNGAGFSAQPMIDSTQRSSNFFFKKACVSIAIAIPEFIICMFLMHTEWMNRKLIFDISRGIILEFILATISMLLLGRPIIISAIMSALKGTSGMYLLISIGISVAYVASILSMLLVSSLNSKPDTFFETVTTLLASISVGKYLECRAKEKCLEHVKSITSVYPKYAKKIEEGKAPLSVPLRQVCRGDFVFVSKGERIPVDGVLIDETVVDESLITGESVPVEKKCGDQVFAGTLSHADARIVATQVGMATLLNCISDSIKSAQKPQIQTITDRIAGFFVPIIVSIGLLTFCVWCLLSTLDWAPTYYYKLAPTPILAACKLAITVVTVACPCALGLATPMALVIGKGEAAKHGIIILKSCVFDRCHLLDTVLFDKTGTLTIGRAHVIAYRHIGSSCTISEALSICKSLEFNSQHILGRAVEQYCQDQKAENISVNEINQYKGGVIGKVDEIDVVIGSFEFSKTCGVSIVHEKEDFSQGFSVVYFGKRQELIGYFVIGDSIRSDAKNTIDSMKISGLNVEIVSGDQLITTSKVAESLGIKEFHAEKSPFEKADIVSDWQESGNFVLFVGDGVNDSPAMARATMSISMGATADLTVSAADIVILNQSLNAVPKSIQICEAVRLRIFENLKMAFAYNIIAIPVSAGVFLKFGIFITPMFSSIFMAMSSLAVIYGSLCLKRTISHI